MKSCSATLNSSCEATINRAQHDTQKRLAFSFKLLSNYSIAQSAILKSLQRFLQVAKQLSIVRSTILKNATRFLNQQNRYRFC